jgi:hypothetical protein
VFGPELRSLGHKQKSMERRKELYLLFSSSERHPGLAYNSGVTIIHLRVSIMDGVADLKTALKKIYNYRPNPLKVY